jgi:hypothetical protein
MQAFLISLKIRPKISLPCKTVHKMEQTVSLRSIVHPAVAISISAPLTWMSTSRVMTPDWICFYIDPADGAIRSGKWNRPTDDQVNLIRLAEMYLTRAEANFRLGEIVGDTPLNDINRVRDRVELDPLLITELDLDAILQERKLELMFEGNLLHDIKRTQRNVGARTYDDPKLVLPIPRRDIDVNPNLCQNPTYTGPQC